MMLKDGLDRFWKKEIRSRFDARALNHKIRLLDGTFTRYANLDNAATTIPFLKVNEKLNLELAEYGSIHRGTGKISRKSSKRYEEVRKTVLNFVNARHKDYCVFVPNTTIGINQLAYFFAHIKGKIMVSDIEHSSSLLPWIFQEGRYKIIRKITMEEALAGKTNSINKRILNEGKKHILVYKTKSDFSFDLNHIEKMIKKNRVKALVVTGASNVTGYKPPLKKLSQIAHNHGAMLIVDACQLLQHERINMIRQDIDFVIFSGHKMYAPFGGGVIVGDKRIFDAFWPYQMGGGNFAYINKSGDVLCYKSCKAHDPGSPNFVGARAIHHAIKELEMVGADNIAKYEHTLVKYAFEGLSKIENVKLYVKKNIDGTFDRSLISFNIHGTPHKLVAEILNCEYGIGVRAGSYCVYEFSRRINKITHQEDQIITAEVKNGVTANIPGSVRASFSMYNNVEDASRLVSAVKEIAERGFEYYKTRYVMNEKTGIWKPTAIQN